MPTTTNFGWTTPADTDYVKDGANAIRTLANGIDTSLVDLKGGTTGQILSKNSNTDLDYTWINNDQGDITNVGVSSPITGGGSSGSVTIGIQDGTTAQKGAVQLTDSTSSTSTTTAATPNSVKSAYDLANGAIPKTLTTTTGDIIYASSANTPARLGIGSSGQVLTVSAGVPAWATAASGSTFAGCRVFSSSNQSISNTTETALTWDSETFDTDGFHSTSTNTDRITIPSGKGGYYLVSAGVRYNSTGSGKQDVYLVKNSGGTDTQFVLACLPGGQDVGIMASGVINLAAGDYVYCKTYQNSGGSLQVNKASAQSFFSVAYLGA